MLQQWLTRAEDVRVGAAVCREHRKNVNDKFFVTTRIVIMMNALPAYFPNFT
jgi:hypothetical protein